MPAPMPPSLRALVALVWLAHALLGASLGLSVDEAHYALYAAHPALSYFDHPPLVGWVQWPLVALDAPTVVLRLLPGAFWLATVWGVYRLTLQLVSDAARPARAAFAAVLALLLAPLLHILAIGLLPDTLLMLGSVALMAQTLHLMQPAAVRHTRAWLLLGLLLGLAGLSKYTAIFSALAVLLCLLGAHGLGVLRQRGPWLACAVALLLVSPVLLWNAANHWVSFTYQAKHGAGSAWQALHVLRFGVLQCLAFGPLLLWAGAGWAGVDRSRRSLWAFFAVPFAVLALMAGGGSSLPHWTAPAWVAVAPFAGIGLARAWDRGHRFTLGLLAGLQALACVALPALMVTGGMPFLAGQTASASHSDAPNPFADLHGWDVAGTRARQLARAHGLDAVAVQNWTLASRLGWYARPLPVYVLEDRFDQFVLWAGKLPPGGSALLLNWSQLPYETPLGAHGFADCRLLETLHTKRLGTPLAHFELYACHGWSGAPAPRLQSAPD